MCDFRYIYRAAINSHALYKISKWIDPRGNLSLCGKFVFELINFLEE
jgi:hypothetical protein